MSESTAASFPEMGTGATQLIDRRAASEALNIALPLLGALVDRGGVRRVEGSLPVDYPDLPGGSYALKPYLLNRTDPANRGGEVPTLGVWNVSAWLAGEEQPALNVNVMSLPSRDGAVPVVKDRRFREPASPQETMMALGILRFAGGMYAAQQETRQAEAQTFPPRPARSLLAWIGARRHSR